MDDNQDGVYPGNGWDSHQNGPPVHENSNYPFNPEVQQMEGGYDEEVGPQIPADIDRYVKLMSL